MSHESELKAYQEKFISDLAALKQSVNTLATAASTLSEPGRVLVGGSMAENMLSWVLKSAMMGGSNRLLGRIFEGYGPLSTFSAKIDVAAALKLIDTDTVGDLRAIKDIRNHFAHATTIASFTHSEVADLCKKLNSGAAPKDNYEAFRLAIVRCVERMKPRIAPELRGEFIAEMNGPKAKVQP